MLEINVEQQEFYDESTEMFFTTSASKVKIEHSLISIAKWEGIWKKSYFPSIHNPGLEGPLEELSYIECMLVGSYQPYIPGVLQTYHAPEIYGYINDNKTATTIHRIGTKQKQAMQTITAEVVYYWMIKFGIPFECEKWHFSRLITLIDVCNVKENSTAKGNKMSAVDSARYRQELNEQRLRAQS